MTCVTRVTRVSCEAVTPEPGSQKYYCDHYVTRNADPALPRVPTSLQLSNARVTRYSLQAAEIILFQKKMKRKILLIWNSSSQVLSRVMMAMMTESIMV